MSQAPDKIIRIPGRYREFLQSGIARVGGDVQDLNHHLGQALGSAIPQPAAVRNLSESLIALGDAMRLGSGVGTDVEITGDVAPVAKTVVLARRRTVAQQVEMSRRNTISHESLAELDNRLEPFRYFATTEWFRSTKALQIPKLSDYLTQQYLEKQRPARAGVPPEYDPKFGILFSAAQLFRDLPRQREECESRSVGLSVLFMDIDDFKKLNSRYGEPVVDRELLPSMMRILEAAFFGHGTVYRYGGDEFVALLPNHPQPVLLALLQNLRSGLRGANYARIPERPSVSIGACELVPGESLTEEEALDRASVAKRFAKESGKNATAGYATGSADADEPEIWERGS